MAVDAVRLHVQTGGRRSLRRRAAGWAGTLAVAAGVLACALFVWPGFLRGGTAYVIVSGNSMEPTLHSGDIVLTVPRGSYDVGDVVAYRIPNGGPGAGVLVIHRIVGGSATTGYVMQGDNRAGRDAWRPRPRSVVGAAAVTVPHLGIALAWLRTPLGLATLAGIVTLLVIAGGSGAEGGSQTVATDRAIASRPRRRRLSSAPVASAPNADSAPRGGTMAGRRATGARRSRDAVRAAGEPSREPRPARKASTGEPRPGTISNHERRSYAFPLALSQSWGEGTWTACDLWMRSPRSRARVSVEDAPKRVRQLTDRLLA